MVSSNVKLVKFPKMDEIDSGLFEKAVESFFEKIGSDSELVLSLKDYAKGGLRVQHELHAKVFINGKTFFAEEKGWKLLGVIQKALDVLEKEVKKDFSKRK
jgi:ribosome-associated translation inhibitor RaiA